MLHVVVRVIAKIMPANHNVVEGLAVGLGLCPASVRWVHVDRVDEEGSLWTKLKFHLSP